MKAQQAGSPSLAFIPLLGKKGEQSPAGMGKARGQRVVNFVCFTLNKYKVRRQEPFRGGGREVARRGAGGSTGQPQQSPPLAVFHFHPYLCPISSVPASSGVYLQAVRDARRDVIFPPGLIKPICWSCRPAQGGISRPCLGPGADGVRIWRLPVLYSRVCFDSLAASGRGRGGVQDPSRPGCRRDTWTGTQRPSHQSARGLRVNTVVDGVQVVGLFWRCDFQPPPHHFSIFFSDFPARLPLK